MLRILYKSGLYNYPVLDGTKNAIEGGMVATFCSNRTVKKCSPGDIPCGFFWQDLPPDDTLYFSNFNNSVMVSVLVGLGEFSTDVFEPGNYRINDFLYCSENSKVTNDPKYKGNIIIGLVNYVTPEEIGFVTMHARGLDLEQS